MMLDIVVVVVDTDTVAAAVVDTDIVATVGMDERRRKMSHRGQGFDGCDLDWLRGALMLQDCEDEVKEFILLRKLECPIIQSHDLEAHIRENLQTIQSGFQTLILEIFDTGKKRVKKLFGDALRAELEFF